LSVDHVVNAISSIVVLSFVWLFSTHNLFPCQIAHDFWTTLVAHT
jgi:hypothetical protein